MTAIEVYDYGALDDMALARLVIARDDAAVRHLLTANNQRLFRAAWSILMNRAEAEEALQDAYLKAFAAMSSFKGASALSTWLTRIVVNEALDRRKRIKRHAAILADEGVAFIDDYREALMKGSTVERSPEQTAMQRELAKIMEIAIAGLPPLFRPVFVMREIEGLDVAETAQALGLTEETVRTRLHRAKQKLKVALEPQLAGVRSATLHFAGADCQALTTKVMARLGFV